MAEKKKIKEEKTSSKMYIGPGIRKYGLVPGTVYMDYPSNVLEAIKEYPEISQLFLVIDEKFVENKGKVKEEGTKENILFKKILKKLGGK